MAQLGGVRGLIGAIVASGMVALPLGTVASLGIAHWWEPAADPSFRYPFTALVWLLALGWGLLGELAR